MKEQVLSVEQMQELIDMGIDVSKASMYWTPENYLDVIRNEHDRDAIPDLDFTYAFTLQDILEILPVRYGISRILDEDKLSERVGTYELLLQNRYLSGFRELKSFFSNSLLEAAFEALKWCKQNGYL